MLREFTDNLGEVADHLAKYQFTHEWDKFAKKIITLAEWNKWNEASVKERPLNFP